MCSRDRHQHVSRTLIGVRLRQLRERSDIPVPTAARRLGVSQATVLRLELGDPKIRYRPSMVAELSRIYGAESDVTRSLAETAELVQADNRFDPYSRVLPPGLERCVDVEPCATAIRTYGPGQLPSLLQTGQYAAAVGGVSSEVWARVCLQQTRMASLKKNGTCLQFLIGESALVRPVAGAGVMADQLHRVNEIGELANVSVRVVPADLPAASRAAGFEIVDVPEMPWSERASTLVFVERPEKGWEMLPETRVAVYGRTFSTFLRHALSDEDSRDLIAEVARMFGRRCRARWRLTVVPRVSVRRE